MAVSDHERCLDAHRRRTLMASATNSPVPTTALGRLAAHYGIEPEFRDARGEDIVTSPETQKRLLSPGRRSEHRNRRHACFASRSECRRPINLAVRCCRPARCMRALLGHHGKSLSGRSDRLALEDGTQRYGTHELSGRSEQAPRIDSANFRLSPPSFARVQRMRHLIVTPGKCWLPDSLHQRTKLWGIATQLYLLRLTKIGASATLRSAKTGRQGSASRLSDSTRCIRCSSTLAKVGSTSQIRGQISWLARLIRERGHYSVLSRSRHILRAGSILLRRRGGRSSRNKRPVVGDIDGERGRAR
jgi:hypothetical protein